MSLKPAPFLGGVDIRIGDNRIVERDDLAIVSVAVPQGGEGALAAALKDKRGLDMPDPRMTREAGGTRAIRTAPDQMLLIFAHDGPDAEPTVKAELGGLGYTTDQTDVWVMLEVSGPDTGAALERLCPLDLHDAAFPPGAAARTVAEHMGCLILRLTGDGFLLMSASSSARSFLHAVETSYRNVTD